MTPEIYAISDEIERDAWKWASWAIVGETKYFQKDDEWHVEVQVEVRGMEYDLIIDMYDLSGHKKRFRALMGLPAGGRYGEVGEYKDIEGVKTIVENYKRDVEAWLNEILGELVGKFTKLQDEYKAGWRLRFPVEFAIEVSEKGYFVVPRAGEMPRVEREVCSWLASEMRMEKYMIDVDVSEYGASAYEMWDVVERRSRLRLSFKSPIGSLVYSWIAIDVQVKAGLLTSGSVRGEDEKSLQVVAVMLNYMKREIEERLNGLLERMLYG
jgi:hypothetical protein